MATFQDILTEIDTLPGVTRLTTERVENLSKNLTDPLSEVNVNFQTWQINLLIRLRRRTSKSTIKVFILRPGQQNESAWKESEIPEVFEQQVEKQLKLAGYTKYKIDEVDEHVQFALVTVYQNAGANKESIKKYIQLAGSTWQIKDYV